MDDNQLKEIADKIRKLVNELNAVIKIANEHNIEVEIKHETYAVLGESYYNRPIYYPKIKQKL